MDIPPVGFGQSQKFPINPVGDSPLRHHIENQSRNSHYQKSEQGEKRSQSSFVQFVLIQFQLTLRFFSFKN